MAESVEYLVGFVYSVVYKISGATLIVEGELLSFDGQKIEIKGPKGPIVVELSWITKILRK